MFWVEFIHFSNNFNEKNDKFIRFKEKCIQFNKFFNGFNKKSIKFISFFFNNFNEKSINCKKNVLKLFNILSLKEKCIKFIISGLF